MQISQVEEELKISIAGQEAKGVELLQDKYEASLIQSYIGQSRSGNDSETLWRYMYYVAVLVPHVVKRRLCCQLDSKNAASGAAIVPKAMN